VHYQTPQYEYIAGVVKGTISQNKTELLINLKNWVIGPQLSEQKHREVFMLVGDDFTHTNDSIDF
jgi:hypothetical protein